MVPVETGSDATSLSEMLVASQAEVAREVANLRQETDRRLRALDERVAALARTFGEVPDFTTGRLSLERFTNFTLKQLEGQLGSQYDGDEWTDLLEEAGDVGTPEDKALGAAALKGLGSNDPAVRGASARAILRIFPEHAQDALEEALAAERNPRGEWCSEELHKSACRVTLAVRSIRDAKAWRKQVLRDAVDTSNPPLSIVREFIPSEKEWSPPAISVFLVEDEPQALLVAAALALSFHGPSEVFLAAADTAILAHAGVKLERRRAGTTFVDAVDGMHALLSFESHGDLVSTVAPFVKTEPFEFQAPQVVREVARLVAEQVFPFKDMAGSSQGSAGQTTWNSIKGFIHQEHLRSRPSP